MLGLKKQNWENQDYSWMKRNFVAAFKLMKSNYEKKKKKNKPGDWLFLVHIEYVKK